VTKDTGLIGFPVAAFNKPQPGRSATQESQKRFFFMGRMQACPLACLAAVASPRMVPGPWALPSTSSTRTQNN
jgi:hypothetical protein